MITHEVKGWMHHENSHSLLPHLSSFFSFFLTLVAMMVVFLPSQWKCVCHKSHMNDMITSFI